MKQLALTAYPSTPDHSFSTEQILWYAAVGVFIIVFTLFGNWIRVKRQKRIGHITHIFTDDNPRYLHLISDLMLMRDDLRFFRHLLFDLSEKKYYPGGAQKGNALRFGSPFMKRSVAALSEKLHIKLGPHFPEDPRFTDSGNWESEDDWEEPDESEAPESESFEFEIIDVEEAQLTEIPVHKQNGNDHLLRSNKISDHTYFLLTENEQNGLSTLIYTRNSMFMGEYNLKLKYGNIHNLLIVQNGKLACFSYEKSTFTGSSQALCLLNLESGVLEYDQVIRV